MRRRPFRSREGRDRDRAEEIAAHIDLYVEELVARGVAEPEARRRARLAFGNPRARREELDDMNRLPMLDVLTRDVRYALRMLRRSPVFTLTTMLTLSLVIGANSAVFSLADGILLRPLPYPQPERLARVVTLTRSTRGDFTESSQDGATWEAVRDGATAIDVALHASGFGSSVNLVVGNAAVSVSQTRVSAGYFRVLGVQLLRGREFTPEEDRPGGPAVAVLTFDLWHRVFQGDATTVGRTLLLRGEAYQVVGILPQSFKSLGDEADVFTPARPSTRGEGGGANYGVIARVLDGHAWADADGELRALGTGFFAARGLPKGVTRWLGLVPMQEQLVQGVREPIAMLAAAVGAVLLIACVNLAALLLARGTTRAREIATRMALGSGRANVVRQLMVESALIGLGGGLLGLGVAALGLSGLQALGGDTFDEWRQVALDGRTLAVTIGLSLVTSLLFGLVPALQASRFDVNAALSEGGSRAIAGGARHWIRRVLVTAEVALGMVLLVITGLLVRNLADIRSLEAGFDSRGLTTAALSLQDARYDTAAKVNRLFDDSLAELARTPGVESAAVSLQLPYTRLLNNGFRFEDDPPDADARITNVMYVTPGFFRTLRVPLRGGRVFTETDRAGAPPVVIVNDTFVRSWGQGQNVLGRRLGRGPGAQEIVGVVGDFLVTNSGIGFPGAVPGPLMTTPIIFQPAGQTSDGFLRLVHTWFPPIWSVRAGPSVNTAETIVRAISRADPLLPVGRVQSMGTVEAQATSRERLLTSLVTVLGAAALLLAALGIHGLIAGSVAERTREFGIRLALGATPAQTIRRVAFSGVALAAIGAAIGFGGAWMAVRLVESFLWRVPAHDPVTFAGVAAFLIVVALVASVIPALRILRLDPAKTLRT